MFTAALVALTLSNESRAIDVSVKQESTLSVTAGGHRWRFNVRAYRAQLEDVDRTVEVSCDGKVVWEESLFSEKRMHLPHGNYVKIGRVGPFIAMRGHTGIGHHEDTLFYSLVGNKMILAGRSPSKNAGGPVPYRGRKDLWLFDDYDWYAQCQPLTYVLYRLDKSHKLRKVRSWRSSGVRLRDTVKL